LKPFNTFTQGYKKELTKQKIKYKLKKDAWEKRHYGIRHRLDVTNIDSEESDQILNQLAEHELKKPTPPKSFCFRYDDVTKAALLESLMDHHPCAALISAEGGNMLKNGAFQDESLFNKFWSGEIVDVKRKTSRGGTLDNLAFSMSIMIQNAPFQEYLAKKGKRSIGNGFWARFLVSEPKSTAGQRFIPTHDTEQDAPLDLQPFYERIEVLLTRLGQHYSADSDSSLIVMEFSEDAKVYWRQIYNEIEGLQGSYGHYEPIKEYASKLMENISRVAALMHYFEYDKPVISLQSLQTAADICTWHAEQYRAIFNDDNRVEKYANIYLKTFQDHFILQGIYHINRQQVHALARKQCDKDCLQKALDLLEESGWIYQYKIGRTKWTNLVPQQVNLFNKNLHANQFLDQFPKHMHEQAKVYFEQYIKPYLNAQPAQYPHIPPYPPVHQYVQPYHPHNLPAQPQPAFYSNHQHATNTPEPHSQAYIAADTQQPTKEGDVYDNNPSPEQVDHGRKKSKHLDRVMKKIEEEAKGLFQQ
ncbi:MAG: DUF3987 domain-containing protein, partial [Methyloprofundus sp.]|nr:DUF3987 domain-containing protein [Methyloprofundus sp.]